MLLARFLQCCCCRLTLGVLVALNEQCFSFSCFSCFGFLSSCTPRSLPGRVAFTSDALPTALHVLSVALELRALQLAMWLPSLQLHALQLAMWFAPTHLAVWLSLPPHASQTAAACPPACHVRVLFNCAPHSLPCGFTSAVLPQLALSCLIRSLVLRAPAVAMLLSLRLHAPE